MNQLVMSATRGQALMVDEKINNMIKGCVYYTGFKASPDILRTCQEQLKKSFDGEIISVSLNKSLDLGKNIVLKGSPGTITMFRQILLGLENSKADFVFLTEDDVLYHKSHFDFTPPQDDKFYYNVAVFRWDFPKDRAITYDHLRSVSGLCANRNFLLSYYRNLLQTIEEKGWKDIGGEPKWARVIGYEPGKIRNSMSPDLTDEWKSESPNVDIRHGSTMTKRKTRLEDFKHKPVNWREVSLKEVPGWDLHSLFHL